MATQRVPLSILDLVPVSEGMSRKEALDNSLELVKLADQIGYNRYWVAEHHGSMAFMASATSLLLGRAAEHTSRIRLGSGGVMMPNHSPLMVAEYYGTLATLYPNRIDLGLGRAPGTDPVTAAALNRGKADLRSFSADVQELANYLAEPDEGEYATEVRGAEAGALGLPFAPDRPLTSVRAIPGQGTQVPLWMLGSSTGGAQVAAQLGLPFSFASHFAPAAMRAALTIYRADFTSEAPTCQIEKPYVMAGINVMVAPTQEEAEYLYTTNLQMQSRIRRGHAGQLPAPTRDLEGVLGVAEASLVRNLPSAKAIGDPQQVAQKMQAFVTEHDLDELIVTCYAFDPALRMRSLQLLADAWFA
ncbi:MAG: LLM class flavin-dependent oxidoreductase [Winkia neuii]|uniref:LLM class flavin-dependent oxidoreductase n=1 Tax=Winkia neuii TaxID=33007 RepID=A0A2I1IN80_9ACTO|nr:LLM class flavin-dependent oxidoreductase [Winkia neuii]OFJ69542.1 alkane 1-monooxygenase [Actinomyces sp. HMSC064C12]OFK01516.1 alkane 1-monooxygenase [Actinomyces sp. HMSC072A03]OFT55066.1 alkane 1-monooxygenase [Actinomyces sp. HMSC06A08]KWZ75055.1 luciferase family oxidoreductase, FMN-dependent, PP_0088 family [Winkia neuii]MDK8100036.1 LLM class flavin-dependent oxidoreductase [Winkia neuii]